jgi:hypothetical protein
MPCVEINPTNHVTFYGPLVDQLKEAKSRQILVGQLLGACRKSLARNYCPYIHKPLYIYIWKIILLRPIVKRVNGIPDARIAGAAFRMDRVKGHGCQFELEFERRHQEKYIGRLYQSFAYQSGSRLQDEADPDGSGIGLHNSGASEVVMIEERMVSDFSDGPQPHARLTIDFGRYED